MSDRTGFGSFAEALGISESAFTLLRDLIEQRLGVYYDDGKRDLLADRLAELVARYGMHSFLDYYYTLKYDAEADRYWLELMDRLSVPETYFWRQPEQFEVLASCIVPKYFAEHPGSTLRIWSAACCTGEEPLSIAMALTETDGFRRGRIEIVATDASPAMVARAKQGVYGERSFRNLPPDWRERYFTKVARGWQVSPALHRHIDWRVVNLLAPEQVQQLPRADVVFCRNVLIYFSDAAIEKVANTLAHNMSPDGKLFLGASESLTRIRSAFTLDEIGNAFVYLNRSNGMVHTLGRKQPA